VRLGRQKSNERVRKIVKVYGGSTIIDDDDDEIERLRGEKPMITQTIKRRKWGDDGRAPLTPYAKLMKFAVVVVISSTTTMMMMMMMTMTEIRR